jgi:hypothetical protein
MSRLDRARDLAVTGLGAAAAVIGMALGVALIAFIMVGGTFYRTSCPSKVSWSFNPIPFVHVVHVGETECSVDTATGYYTGKVPLVGRPLRALVKSFTGQNDGTTQ